VAAAKKNGVRLGVMFQRHADPLWKKAKAIVDSRTLGDLIRTCMIEPHFRSQAYYDSGGWRATWSGEGGGVMMNQAPHSLDAFVWLGGMPSRVFGKVDTRAHRIEVEDTASALLTYPNGATGYINTSTFEFPGVTLFQFVGDRASIEIRNGKLRLGVSAPPVGEFIRTTREIWATPLAAWTDVDVPAEPHGHRCITQNFVNAILDGEPVLATGEASRDSLELANAITVSSALGKEVDIPLDRSLFDNLLKKYVAGSQSRKTVKPPGKIIIPKV
jgi:predicted dehydrogenase